MTIQMVLCFNLNFLNVVLSEYGSLYLNRLAKRLEEKKTEQSQQISNLPHTQPERCSSNCNVFRYVDCLYDVGCDLLMNFSCWSVYFFYFFFLHIKYPFYISKSNDNERSWEFSQENYLIASIWAGKSLDFLHESEDEQVCMANGTRVHTSMLIRYILCMVANVRVHACVSVSVQSTIQVHVLKHVSFWCWQLITHLSYKTNS